MTGESERRVPFRRIGPGNVVLFLAGIALTILAVVGVQALARDADVKACQRANKVREESNLRIPAHKADKRALLKLTEALTQTRRLEAQVFKQFEIMGERQVVALAANPETASQVPQARATNELVHKLRVRYETAAGIDKEIAKFAKKVTFRHQPILDCEEVVE